MANGLTDFLALLRRRPTAPQPPATPFNFRQPPTLPEVPYRSQQPPTLGSRAMGVVEGEGAEAIPPNWMVRTPGGTGETAAAWTARQPQGVAMEGVGRPYTAPFRRPTEELYKQAFRPAEQVAPGAREAAGRELYERIGPSPAEQLEIQKAQIPLRQQEIAGQYGLREEALKGQYGLQTEQEKQRALREGYEVLRGFLGAGGQRGGLEPGSSVSLSGIGSVRAPLERQAPQGLLRDLTAARTAWEGSESAFGNRDETLANQYRQTLGAVFGQDPADSLTKELALQIATDPEWSNMPVNQLLADPRLNDEWDTSDMSPDEIEDLDRLLNYSRGASAY